MILLSLTTKIIRCRYPNLIDCIDSRITFTNFLFDLDNELMILYFP